MTIRIAYPGSESRAITLNGEIVEYNEWDDKLNGYSPIKQTKCGENRFIGVKNILEFYITDGCTLQIQPRDAIQTLVRMEWSFDEFYSEGGTTSFVDRLAGSLGIHASTIKVVSVYDGSLVVNYELAPTKEEPLSLEDIAKKQTEKFAEGKVELGAPILDVAAGKEKVVADGVVTAQGFAPVVLVETPTNSNAIARQHVNLMGVWELAYLSAGGRCEEKETTNGAPARRPRCKASLCCGKASNPDSVLPPIEVCHTRDAPTYNYRLGAFETEEWQFACVDGAAKVAASLSAVLAIAVAYLMA